MRCFVALDLPREVMKHIHQIQETLRKQNLFVGKYVDIETLHLTLKFLGEIDEEQAEEVKERLRKIEFPEIEVRLGETGVFSSKYSSYIRVVWVKLEGADRLQKQVDQALEGLFQPEFRFMSHITIARVKKVRDRKRLVEYIKSIKSRKIRFKVDKFFLKQSTLHETGPVYEDLEEYNLEEKK